MRRVLPALCLGWMILGGKEHRSSSKKHRSRLRSFLRHNSVVQDNIVRDAQRLERLRLFGYYSDSKSGTVYSVGEVRGYYTALITGEIPRRAINVDNLVYHSPESIVDQILSIGERYVPKDKDYPALQITAGDVLRDPKIVICDPNPQIYTHPHLRKYEREMNE